MLNLTLVVAEDKKIQLIISNHWRKKIQQNKNGKAKKNQDIKARSVPTHTCMYTYS